MLIRGRTTTRHILDFYAEPAAMTAAGGQASLFDELPRDRFVIAGDAWAQCRAGETDPEQFGIFDKRGLWYVAGNLMRDAAALDRMEMLGWDVWGAMPGSDRPLQPADWS